MSARCDSCNTYLTRCMNCDVVFCKKCDIGSSAAGTTTVNCPSCGRVTSADVPDSVVKMANDNQGKNLSHGFRWYGESRA